MKHTVPAKTVFTDPVHFLAFGFGSGLSPVAPGTFGTIVGIAFELPLRLLSLPARAVVISLLFAIGVWLCGESARRLDTHDHPGIVWDEIVGFLITMLVAPPGWQWLVAGFVLFRFFDILNPWPIREMDHSIRGGAGIMLDDVAAGLYAALALYALQQIPGIPAGWL